VFSITVRGAIMALFRTGAVLRFVAIERLLRLRKRPIITLTQVIETSSRSRGLSDILGQALEYASSWGGRPMMNEID